MTLPEPPAPLEFNVATDGTVSQVTPTAATPSGLSQYLAQYQTPEVAYNPPAPSKEQPAVVTQLEQGVLLTVIIDGKRYAVTSATEEDARAFLSGHPEMCLVP